MPRKNIITSFFCLFCFTLSFSFSLLGHFAFRFEEKKKKNEIRNVLKSIPRHLRILKNTARKEGDREMQRHREELPAKVKCFNATTT